MNVKVEEAIKQMRQSAAEWKFENSASGDVISSVISDLAEVVEKAVNEADEESVFTAINKFVEDSNRPKRNCDRPFKTLGEFQRYYIEHGCKNGLGMVSDGEITKVPWKSSFEKWMLEPWKE